MGKTVKILHFSPHNEECGVGKYQENYLDGMSNIPEVENKFFEVTPYDILEMSEEDLSKTLGKLSDELENYDVFHIQHEFGLYRSDGFKKVVEAASASGKKIVITVHLSPTYAIKPATRGGFGPHSIVDYMRKRRHYNRMVVEHVEPMKLADKLIVNNTVTADSLKSFGISEDRIVKLVHPVYDVPEPPKTSLIAQSLDKKDGDVIFCMIGFLHRKKGVMAAVKALKFLPENYKLALLGGVKSDSIDFKFEDKITDLIDSLGLHKRVYITGYVADDDELNGLIRECDVCVYPYDKIYYSNVSSGSLNLSFANQMPAIAYPTDTLKESAAISDGALILTESFSYYELARELKKIDVLKQQKLSQKYAKKMAWPVMAKKLAHLYQEIE